MPSRDPRAFLADIIAAADAIASMTQGVDVAGYAANFEKRSAVERQLIIVGEAVLQIRRLRADWIQRLTAPERIIAFRNIMVHGYHHVLHDVVWDVVTHHLPTLRAEAQSLLTESGSTEP